MSQHEAHCSNHAYFMVGCTDCENAELVRLSEKWYFTKAGHSPIEIRVGEPSPHLQLVRQQLQRVLRMFLHKAAHDASSAIYKVGKAKYLDETIAEAKAAFEAIKWDNLVDDVSSDLSAAVQIGGMNGIAQLELDMSSEIEAVN